MTRVPEAQNSPEGLAYEGRLLDKQDEEVVDQGLPFDVGTLINRRGVLGVFGAGVGAFTLAACGVSGGSGSSASTSADSTEIPDETAGPYPGDGSNGPDVLEESGVVRSDIRSSIGGGATAEGVPMTLELTILDLANGGAAFADTAVYVWHCNAAGEYSMYSEAISEETYLRGVQVADAEGKVRFTSIVPACYSGRWPHIHFEVYPDVDSITDSTNAIATSQVALPKNLCDTVFAEAAYEGSAKNLAQVTLDSDNVFGDDGGASQIATASGSVDKGYTLTLTVPVDTRTEPSGGSAPSRGEGMPNGAPTGAPGDMPSGAPTGGPGGEGEPPEGAPTGAPSDMPTASN